jgi:hypothetical protein
MLIAGTLVLGTVLRLGDDLLEVPISAMLIFSSVGEHAAATGRIVDTLVGTAAGLAGGLVFAPLRVQPAREAVSDLTVRLADLLGRMADGLDTEPDQGRIDDWLGQARALRGEIERVEDTLREAEDSVRLNPRALRTPEALTEAETSLRGGLESLEVAALTVRFLARSLLDAVRVPSDASPMRNARTRERLAAVLAQLAAGIRTYGRLVATAPAGDESLEARLGEQLAQAHRLQDELADLLEPDAESDAGTTEWPLRGEILTHVDRLRTGLTVETIRHQAPSRHRSRRKRGARPDGKRIRGPRSPRKRRQHFSDRGASDRAA